MKELCVTCKKETTYYREEHIDQRIGYIKGSGQLCLDCYDELYIKPNSGVKMNKFLKVMDDVIIAILGKSIVEKRSGEDRRKKKPRKRKNEKRIAGKSSDRRKK